MTRPSCPAGALEAVETASRDERRALQRARLKGALRRASDHVAHYQPLLRCGGRASGDVPKTLADRARVRAVTRVGIGRAVARRKSCAAGCQMPDAGCRMQGTSRKTRSTTRRAARAIASIGSTRGRRRAEIRTPPRRVCGVGEAPAGERRMNEDGRRAAVADGRGRACSTMTRPRERPPITLVRPSRFPMIVDRLISEILFGFTGLMGIINPFGIAFLFLERTESLTEAQRAALARKVAINAFIVLLAAFFVGTPILHFFGISLEALRIGGGLAVAVAGWQMLNEPDVPTGGDTAAQPVEPRNAMARAFFPLTIPLTTGPGSIATAIALNANRTHKLSEFVLSSIVSVAVSALAALVIWQTYSRAAFLARYLGTEGTKVAMRVSAFLLLCVGVQIMLTGFSEFLQPIADQVK